jgi:hypothetical protein
MPFSAGGGWRNKGSFDCARLPPRSAQDDRVEKSQRDEEKHFTTEDTGDTGDTGTQRTQGRSAGVSKFLLDFARRKFGGREGEDGIAEKD